MLPWQQSYNTALEYHQTGRLTEAIEAYGDAIQTNPNQAELYINRAIVLRAQGRLEEAVDHYQQAIDIAPHIPEVHYNLANTLKKSEHYIKAIDSYKQALDIKPDLFQAHYNLANVYRRLGRLSQAAAHYQQALTLQPDRIDFRSNLAGTLQDLGRFHEALDQWHQAIGQHPETAELYYNLAITQRDLGHLDEAIANGRKAIQLKHSDFPEAHWNLALSLLMAGRLTEGWREYQWRRYINYQNSYPHAYTQPHWDGSPFPGKRLFIHCEQGVGDAIQFVRLLPLVKQRGGTVVFGVWASVARLLADTPGADEMIQLSWLEAPVVRADLVASLLDLPGLLNITLDTIPTPIPYIHADSAQINHWKDLIAAPGYKVGIVWAGSPKHHNNHNRSCPLQMFAPLSKTPGIRIYGLQKNLRNPQDNEILQSLGIRNIIDASCDFADTAGALVHLDLIISVDTAVLHLAGAMGKPVWGLIPYGPDWRWMLERVDSPWYPTVTLFRQQRPGDWTGVFDRMMKTLEDLSKK